MSDVTVRRYIYRSVRCYMNRSLAYEADDPAVDILRCIRMRSLPYVYIEFQSLQIGHYRIKSTE